VTMADLKESRHLKALKDKLREMFQLDQADLDFGIYRIMNQKRDEIERFLDKDLLPQVREALQEYQPADLVEMQRKLEKAIEGAKAAGIDPEQAPSVRQLRAELEDSIDISKLEEEVYSHLSTFFSRYYQGGDFLSLRRYKEGVYALPYEGEEVKLHWANADQYYIKSTEAFRSYAFKVPQTIPAEPGMTGSIRERRIRFDLVAAGTARDNNKAASGKERRFTLDQDIPLEMDSDELVIRFHYRPDDQKRKQKDLNAEAVEALLALPDGAPATSSIGEWEFWQEALSAKVPTEANANRTVLEKHLTTYTARNSFDYFIHKDLGGFLRRELDFFIKNEIMFLDDIESDTAPRVEQYLSKIKVLRKIAHKIISFLAHLENFQKKLWLKKKFILEVNWLVTLDKVPGELYAEVAANDAQREEWVRLFSIDEMKGDLAGSVKYSHPLTVNFLMANPSLVLDTAFFGENFVDRLFSLIEDVDNETDGLLVHGENFHGLRLIKERYADSVDCIFIDPPYNTGQDEFIYKDNYQSSTWLSMMADRMVLASNVLSPFGGIAATIDDNEQEKLKTIMSYTFGRENFCSQVAWEKRYTRSNNTDDFTSVLDHVLIYGGGPDFNVSLFPRDEDADARYINLDDDPRGPWKAIPFTNPRAAWERPNLCYPIMNPNTGRSKVPDGEDRAWRSSWHVFEDHLNNNRVYWGRDGTSDVPNIKRFLSEVRSGMTPTNLWSHEFAGHTDAAKNEIKQLFGFAAFDNPKPTTLIKRAAQVISGRHANATVLDFFAGSGTTGDAIIKLNQEDGGRRKYILIEAGDHFDTLTRSRISKSVYSSSWKDGKPNHQSGTSQLIKYIRVESYEDVLDNLDLERSDRQNRLLGHSAQFREGYTLRYMMDVEAHESLLPTKIFRHPFGHALSIVRDDERKAVAVDLVETFNYLLGLRVKTRERKRGVLEIVGKSPEGETVLVLWRDNDEVDNDALDDWFQKQGYNSRDLEFDLIYVNGDNNLENLRRTDETWKTRLIEEYFHKLMFDVEGM